MPQLKYWDGTRYVPILGGMDQVSADTRYVKKSGDTMSGDLIIDRTGQISDAKHIIKADTGKYAFVEMYASGAGAAGKRWAVGRGSEAESGSDAGSSFGIWSYKDNGAYLQRVLTVDRPTSEVRVAIDPLTDTGVATKRYVDTYTASGTVTTLGSGWIAYGSPFDPLMCTKHSGMVTIEVVIKRNATLTLTAGVKVAGVCTLPVGFRPSHNINFEASADQSAPSALAYSHHVDIDAAGVVDFWPHSAGTMAVGNGLRIYGTFRQGG